MHWMKLFRFIKIESPKLSILVWNGLFHVSPKPKEKDGAAPVGLELKRPRNGDISPSGINPPPRPVPISTAGLREGFSNGGHNLPVKSAVAWAPIPPPGTSTVERYET